jgi:hypothetical protein
MTIQDLIDQARARRSPEEQAQIDEDMRLRMEAINKREHALFVASCVTEEQLNRLISL